MNYFNKELNDIAIRNWRTLYHVFLNDPEEAVKYYKEQVDQWTETNLLGKQGILLRCKIKEFDNERPSRNPISLPSWARNDSKQVKIIDYDSVVMYLGNFQSYFSKEADKQIDDLWWADCSFDVLLESGEKHTVNFDIFCDITMFSAVHPWDVFEVIDSK